MLKKPLVLIKIILSRVQVPDLLPQLEKEKDIHRLHPCHNQRDVGHDHVTGQIHLREVERNITPPRLHLVQVIEGPGHTLTQITSHRHIHGEKSHPLDHQRDHIVNRDLGHIPNQRVGQTDIHQQNQSHTRRRNTAQDHIHDQDLLKHIDHNWTLFLVDCHSSVVGNLSVACLY